MVASSQSAPPRRVGTLALAGICVDMKHPLLTLPLALSLCLAACSDSTDKLPHEGKPQAAPSISGSTHILTVEGRIEEGAECPVLHTPEGEIYAVTGDLSDPRPGDYVELVGRLVDMSVCQRGRDTLKVIHFAAKKPPARDRDPARAGGLAVTSEYVQGSWVAKGASADCRRPDFQVRRNRDGGSLIETRINGEPETGYVDVGARPAIHWDEKIPMMPIETRGPDGLAILVSQSGERVTLSGHPIAGDGVVFIRCAS